jgi:hypothetical protein
MPSSWKICSSVLQGSISHASLFLSPGDSAGVFRRHKPIRLRCKPCFAACVVICPRKALSPVVCSNAAPIDLVEKPLRRSESACVCARQRVAHCNPIIRKSPVRASMPSRLLMRDSSGRGMRTMPYQSRLYALKLPTTTFWSFKCSTTCCSTSFLTKAISCGRLPRNESAFQAGVGVSPSLGWQMIRLICSISSAPRRLKECQLPKKSAAVNICTHYSPVGSTTHGGPSEFWRKC